MASEERSPIITRADHIPGPKQGEWTYNHYAALPNNGQRYEIIDGVLYLVPSPYGPHQRITVRLVHYFFLHIEERGFGIVYPAPFDVELGRYSVVQPDMTVQMHTNNKVSVPSHMIGPPDLVVEILEPHTKEHDRGRKYNAYARGGVREYWIVDPLARSVEIYALEAGIYHLLGTFRGEDFLPSWVIKDFTVRVNQFFI